jgi:molecular chaperone DnaK (HSP70)
LGSVSNKYIVGIDLGTTNSAVTFIDLEAEKQKGKNKRPRIQIFKVPQLTGDGEVTALSVLPSFLYIPGTYDISKESIDLPWLTEEDNFAGFFAREQGSRVPSRLVSSAKSWLCHENVDRYAKILPWGSEGDIPKVSPVHATATYLNHIRKAWNSSKGDAEEHYLENQIVNT